MRLLILTTITLITPTMFAPLHRPPPPTHPRQMGRSLWQPAPAPRWRRHRQWQWQGLRPRDLSQRRAGVLIAFRYRSAQQRSRQAGASPFFPTALRQPATTTDTTMAKTHLWPPLFLLLLLKPLLLLFPTTTMRAEQSSRHQLRPRMRLVLSAVLTLHKRSPSPMPWWLQGAADGRRWLLLSAEGGAKRRV